MGLEIERRFLVPGDGWRNMAGRGMSIRQGYLNAERRNTVRVRLALDETDHPVAATGDRAWLTIKGPATGAVRQEFEYAVPICDAVDLLQLCGPLVIEKTRYRVPHAGRTWEVDVFGAANSPLVLAEVELESADAEVALPGWIGAEVTDDERYHNASLARRPFSRW